MEDVQGRVLKWNDGKTEWWNFGVMEAVCGQLAVGRGLLVVKL